MSKVAWLFPGQGSQAIGMGVDLAKNEPKAMSILQEADQTLGFSLSELMANGPEDQLKMTEYTQPALLTHSTMVVRSLGNKLPKPDFVAGHSLGEYSALVANEAITFSDALKAVRERGLAMQSAVPKGIGTMAAIIGAANNTIVEACSNVQLQTGMVVVPANFNGPGQIVIAGHNEAIDMVIEIIKAAGCRMAVKLPVSAPFHSPLMLPVQAKFEPILQSLPIATPIYPLVNNIEAAIVSDPQIIRDGLIKQIIGSVLWEKSVNVLLSQDVTQFFELGSGNVLKNLVKRQAKEAGKSVQVHSIADHNDLIAVSNNS